MHTFRYIAAIPLFLLILLYPASEARGQFTCPFSEEEAVADTLDPKGYLPLLSLIKS